MEDMARYREILLAKAKELQRQIRGREITIESAADPLDEVRQAVDRELAIESADRESSMLAAIRAALRKMDDGTFGLCEDCEEPIAPRRLAAVPWATRCLRCQESVERGRRVVDSAEPAEISQGPKRLLDAA